MSNGPRLVVLPTLPVARSGDRFILTRKFISGLCEYQRSWPGPVQVVMEPAPDASDNLDNVAVRQEDLPFELTVLPHESLEIAGVLQGAAVAMLAVHYRQTHLAQLCAHLNVPCIYGAEYSLRTRLQIARTNAPGPLRFARQALWLFGEEWRIRRAVAAASGVQCNGIPTYEAYRRINPCTILFFDTRVRTSMLADESALHRRFKDRRRRGELRLVFSGRLIAIKGADDLVVVADALRRSGRPFRLFICGSGTLEPRMRHEVKRRGLDDVVCFKGNLDFEQELLPFIRDEIDLFVCCHRQGDPSCTYLETMACGVPIVGYSNEAFHGVMEASRAGWATPINRPALLAARITALSDEDIDSHSLRSLAFAREHTFEKEFERRMEHARDLAGLASAAPNASLSAHQDELQGMRSTGLKGRIA
ncbi:glycosyltransferase [Microvirga makkahensis]|uniref:Glycosyltransferase n=1 Tax=Microvirga makkahensis TaxID=1128670 RepID=A0A7X3MV11_9HYPH|nr:glycosyltransferase [Microvirga makkahensis]MXQ13739.1 glycosyltransferase [Microvirga makkahensis]